MAIHIQIGKNNVQSNNLAAKVQSVPFKIHADCDAKISKYFEPYVKKKDDVLTASFRGYPLDGKKIILPEGYTGLVLHESIRPETDKDERKLYVVHTFKSFTHWNWNKISTKNDAIIQALDWIDVAEVLHSPIMEE